MIRRRCHCILCIVLVCISIIKGCESIEDCPDGSYAKVTQPAPVPQHLGRARLVCNFVHDPEITGPLLYLKWSMQDTTLYVYSLESKNIDNVLEPDVVVNFANDYNAGAGHSEILINTQVGDNQTYSCKVFFEGRYHCIHGQKLEFEGLYDGSTTKINLSFREVIVWLIFIISCAILIYVCFTHKKRHIAEHQGDIKQDPETGQLCPPITSDSGNEVTVDIHAMTYKDSSNEDSVDSHAVTYDEGSLSRLIAPDSSNEDTVDSHAVTYNKDSSNEDTVDSHAVTYDEGSRSRLIVPDSSNEDTVDSHAVTYNKGHRRRPIALDSSNQDTVDRHAMSHDKDSTATTTELLSKHYTLITQQMVPESIIPHLIQNKVLTIEDEDIIYHEKGMPAKCRYIVNVLNRRSISSADTFGTFIKCLRESGHDFIANHLEPPKELDESRRMKHE